MCHIIREAFTRLSVYCYYMNIYSWRRSVAVIPVSMCCCSVQPLPDWAVPQSSRLKYRQLFNSHDKMMSGHLTGKDTHHTCFSWCHHITAVFAPSTAVQAFCDLFPGPQARTILMQSSLPQSQLATIWSVNQEQKT